MTPSCLIELPPSEDMPPQAVSAGVDLIRVLHVINGEHYAGAERVQDLLAAGLGPLGFDVAQVCVKSGSFAAMRQAQVPLHLAPMRNRFDLWPALKLARLVRQGGFRLIHSHSVRTAMVGSLAAAMTGVPLVHHLHSPTDRDSNRHWQDRVNAWAERLGVRRAAAVLAVSASLGEYARRQGYAADKITVVPNGVPVVGPSPRASRRNRPGPWAWSR